MTKAMTPPIPSTDLRSELEGAVDAFLAEDARLMRSIVSAIRRSKPGTIMEPCDVPPRRTLEWWDARPGGLPPSLHFIKEAVTAGASPVFAGLSLCVAGSAPTLYVPVPYTNEAHVGFEAVHDLLWCDAPAVWNGPQHDWGASLRTIAHAMANISYSVRVSDSPTRGFLARSHETAHAYYIPDTSDVSRLESLESDVESVARDEERMLGMASVLYIPIVSQEVPHTLVATRSLATAVLILWSPVPGRWDRQLPGVAGSLSRDLEATLAPGLAQEFGLLGAVAAGRERAEHAVSAEVLGVIAALDGLTKHGSTGGREAFARAMHGLAPVLAALTTPQAEARCRVRDWLTWFFEADTGPINKLGNRLPNRLEDRCLALRVRASDSTDEYPSTIGHWTDLHDKIPGDLFLELGCTVAQLLTTEPVVNVSKHCSDISSVEIDLSERYVTVILRTTLPEAKLASLFHGAAASHELAHDAFRRYYASRRGLPLWLTATETSEGLGLGMFLHGLFASRFGVYQRLYVSADGSSSGVVLALPYVCVPPAQTRS